jgi:hypothetical protein
MDNLQIDRVFQKVYGESSRKDIATNIKLEKRTVHETRNVTGQEIGTKSNSNKEAEEDNEAGMTPTRQLEERYKYQRLVQVSRV